MASLKAYPKGSVEPIEWKLGEGIDPAELGGQLSRPTGGTLTVSTSTGWVILDIAAYAALEIVTDQ